MQLFEAMDALQKRGAVWAAQRVSGKLIFDTIQCTTLVQSGDTVLRGLVEVTEPKKIPLLAKSSAKVEITCYFGASLDDRGEFKHKDHPKNESQKCFEWKDTVYYKYGRFLGWRPEAGVPLGHQYLVDMATSLVVNFDQ